ncbi:Protein arginine N-methyltransferase 3 [Armadillidium vulgare]|nr:Protein arginine N-methyltransferase 3 [Armadillidium vulgare]
MEIVKENKLDKRITLKKGRLEDLNFNYKFDVIVSEWMGYFLLFEGMLDSVIYARNHYLTPGGYLLPNRCTLHLVGAEDMEAYNKYVKFWGDVYGFKMSCMVREVIKEASTEVVKKDFIFTTSDQLMDFDLMKVNPEDLEFTTEFSLTAERDANLTSFVGYFDTYFNLPHPVYFSTGPDSPPTHWKQTIFYLPHLKSFKKGESIKGTISVKRKKKEIRSLDVTIVFENKKYHYFVE